jgi:hypothetical protein
LQNIIYNKLIELFILRERDTKIGSSIKESLNKLKDLDEDKHKKVLHIIDVFYKIALEKNELVNSNLLNNFLALRSDSTKISSIKNYVELKNIYFHYDFGEIQDT